MPGSMGARFDAYEGFQKKLLIGPVGRVEDSVPSVAPSHDVVEGSLVFNADLSRHDAMIPEDRVL